MEKNEHKLTQVQKVIRYMQRNGAITTMQAYTDLGITRLASRIHEIKRMGIDIESKSITVDTRDGSKTTVTQYKIA